MKQKKIINVLIIVAVSSLLLFLWFLGLDRIYAEILVIGTNLFLAPWPDTLIIVEIETGAPVFIVETLFDGRKGSFPQEAKLIILPVIMILTWQVLLFFNLPLKNALRSLWENFLIFFLIQVIFLLLLTVYYKSGLAAFIYDLLMDSFYIIALFLIVKDTIKFKLIKLKVES